jgi:hypothetical protein
LVYRKAAAVLLYFAAVSAFAAESPKLSADQKSVLEDARAYALQYAEQPSSLSRAKFISTPTRST